MYKSIRTDELKGMIGRVNIIDIRNSYLYNFGNIPSSINIPSNYLMMDPDRYLKKNEKYYIYCTQGMTSAKVCNDLSNMGYNVVNILGGYHDYISH